MNKLIRVILSLTLANIVLACDQTTISYKILDKGSKTDGAKISFLLTESNVTGNECYEKCCDMSAKEHCNIASFIPKNLINGSVLQSDDLGNCTLISCVPLSSCHLIVSKRPIYSIILNSTTTKDNINGTIPRLLQDLLQTMSNTSEMKSEIENATEVTSSTIETTYISDINYSNGANDSGHSGAKPRKGVAMEMNSTSTESHLSGSKPRKGVQEDEITTSTLTYDQMNSKTSTANNIEPSTSAVIETIDVKTSTEGHSDISDTIPENEDFDEDKITQETSTPPEEIKVTINSSSTIHPQVPFSEISMRHSSQTSREKVTKPMNVVKYNTSNIVLNEEIDNDKKHDEMPISLNLIVGLVLGMLLLITVIGLVFRTVYESWQRRHYRRMDFLVDGMYDN